MEKKESFLNLILIFLSLGFGFIFVEVILRVFDPWGKNEAKKIGGVSTADLKNSDFYETFLKREKK
jgi:hypothetical protein